MARALPCPGTQRGGRIAKRPTAGAVAAAATFLARPSLADEPAPEKTGAPEEVVVHGARDERDAASQSTAGHREPARKDDIARAFYDIGATLAELHGKKLQVRASLCRHSTQRTANFATSVPQCSHAQRAIRSYAERGISSGASRPRSASQ